MSVPVVVGASVSIGDVTVYETDGVARLEVTVRGTPLDPFRVQWSTEDGAARHGHDYVADRGFVEFGPEGGWRATIEVRLIDDKVDEGKETFLVPIGEPMGAPDVSLARGTATVTIANTDPMPRAWLARLGRTVAGQMVDTVTERLEGGFAGDGGSRVTLGGQPVELSGAAAPETLLRLDEETHLGPENMGREPWDPWGPETEEAQTMAACDFLLGSAFHVTERHEDAGRAFVAWGRAVASRFDGTADGLSVDGEVTTAMLGADVEGERWLAGVAFSHSLGDGSFAPSGDDDTAGGEVESALTGVWPYARLALNDRVSAWGLLGAGSGTLALTETGRAPVETDLSTTMGRSGAGARWRRRRRAAASSSR